MVAQIFSRTRPPSETTVKAQALLRRYPNLSKQELATLIDTYPYLPILDIALMTADDQLSTNLAAFHDDHGRKLKSAVLSLTAFLALPAIMVVGVLWWLSESLCRAPFC